MFEDSASHFRALRLEHLHDRIDALSDLIEMDRLESEGFPVSAEELDEQYLRCIDLVMAEETEWLA